MSTIEKISQLSHRIFNTSTNEKNVARTSNPFAASNFQKNILTEDVFESSKSKEDNKNISFTGGLSAGSKRIYSTLVGSLGGIVDRFYEGIESIAAFCGRMKDGITSAWNKIYELGHKEVGSFDGARKVLSRDIMTFFGGYNHEKEIAKLVSMDPRTEVQPMLVESLSALEADLVKAA